MSIQLNTPSKGLSIDEAANAILGFSDSPEGTPTENEDIANTSLETEVEEEETELDSEDSDEETLDEEEETEEEADEEDEEEEDSDEVEEYFEVTITGKDGEEEILEVTQEELVKGYLRQSDYTKKRQKESEEHSAKVNELASKIEEYENGLLDFVTDTELALYEYQQIDWEGLKASDPESFNRLWADALYTEKKYRDAQARLTQVKEGATARAKEQQAAYLKDQKELVQTLIPEWNKIQGKIKSYLVGEGFDDNEIGSIANAKIAVLADKARKFDELQTRRETVSKQKLSKKVPKMVKAGSPNSGSGKAKTQLNAAARLKQSGSIDDAVALLLSRSS